jgi:putative oxidoreductase
MLSKLLGASRPWVVDAGWLLLRLWFGTVMAVVHGWGKVADLGTFTLGVAKRGLPMPELLGPAAALSELVGGLFLAIGLFTRPAASFVAVTMLVAAFHVHAADAFARKELALAYAVTALAVLAAGPGRFSADAWLARRLGARSLEAKAP